MTIIYNYILWFFIYAVAGWVWEEIITSIPAKKLLNRGFLIGPYCPIYGFGATIFVATLSQLINPVAIFLAGAIIASILEYSTSWVMEKLFHARWWDYSNHYFNLQGRICLVGAVTFGFFAVLVIKIFQPLVQAGTDLISPVLLPWLAGLIALIFITDTVISTIKTAQLLKKVDDFQRELNHRLELAKDRFEDTEIYNQLLEPLSQRAKLLERRLVNILPDVESLPTNHSIQWLKQRLLKTYTKKSRRTS